MYLRSAQYPTKKYHLQSKLIQQQQFKKPNRSTCEYICVINTCVFKQIK